MSTCPERLPVGRSRNLRTRWVSCDRNIPPVVLRHRSGSIFSREMQSEIITWLQANTFVQQFIYADFAARSYYFYVEATKIRNRRLSKRGKPRVGNKYDITIGPERDLLYVYSIPTLFCPCYTLVFQRQTTTLKCSSDESIISADIDPWRDQQRVQEKNHFTLSNQRVDDVRRLSEVRQRDDEIA